MKQVSMRLDPALVERVDAARGDVPRTRFVVRALEAALGPESRPVTPAGILSCPVAGCDFTATSSAATCPVHSRRVK